jgi:hypothetical protein
MVACCDEAAALLPWPLAVPFRKDRPRSRGRSNRSPLIGPTTSRLFDRFLRGSDLGNNAPLFLNVVEAIQDRKLDIPRCQTDVLTRYFAEYQAC